jgi:hypothetical protein
MRATYKLTDTLCDLVGREVIYRIDGTVVKILGVSDSRNGTVIQAVCEEDGAIFEDEIHSFKLIEEEEEHERNC